MRHAAVGGLTLKSKYDGATLTQDHLASSDRVATAANKVTTWTSKRWITGVNRWRGVNWFVQVHAPIATLTKAIFLHSIGDNSMPFGADTVEFANGTHYNGHPVSKTIGHWLAA